MNLERGSSRIAPPFNQTIGRVKTGDPNPERCICDACALRIVGIRSDEKEHAALTLPSGYCLVPEDDDSCTVCGGLLKRLEPASRLPLAELSAWEFSTFWVGTKVEFGLLAREQEVAADFGIVPARSIKVDINRRIGLLIASATGKEARLENPDMLIIIDIAFLAFELEPAPLFIYGRYTKLARGIPQTKWPCRKCHGKGCSYCDFKGRMYETSVEEIVAAPAMRTASAASHSFHGMGREDIDALMLGEGRPFILQLDRPHRRSFSLTILCEQINIEGEGIVHVSDLRFSNREEVRNLKAAAPHKAYVARFTTLGKVNKEKLVEVLSRLSGTTLSQRTPLRVAHRRADLVRMRTIVECRLLEYDGQTASVEIIAESGTYIKEFVTGDGGRTVPSISESLGTGCTVISLDVMKIETGAGDAW